MAQCEFWMICKTIHIGTIMYKLDAFYKQYIHVGNILRIRPIVMNKEFLHYHLHRNYAPHFCRNIPAVHYRCTSIHSEYNREVENKEKCNIIYYHRLCCI